MIKINLIIRILVICIFINKTFEISTISSDYRESSINDDQNSDFLIPCNKSCTICGQNSISCTFISDKCEIKCHCFLGFNGSKCEYLIPNYQYFTKEDLWSVIHGQVLRFSKKLVLENMIYLVTNFKQLINEYDIFNTYLILDGLNTNDITIFSTEDIELLYNYINLLISCNNNNNSIFLKANQLYNMSSLGVLNSVDQITTKYVNLNNNNSYLLIKLEKFQVLVSSFNSFNTVNNNTKLFEIIPSQINDLSIEMDSISLNETILKREFRNDTIKIILKIFYTLQKNENQTLTLESNETSFSLKSNLFFDISHPTAQVEYNEPYIISSTILSAILIHKSKIIHNLTSVNKYEKFVRIQFTIVVSKAANFEKNLKCVYWDDYRLNWSTSGCFKSKIESAFIINKKFFRQVCYCNHLTNFALLFDPNPYSALKNDEIDDLIFNYILSIISYIGITVSLICYFIMIITRLFSVQIQNANDTNSIFNKNIFSFPFKILNFGDSNQGSSQSNSSSNQQSQNIKKPKKRCDYILRCLYLANIIFLFLANISFIVSTLIKRHDNLTICNATGLSLQYFLLAAFCFSLGIAYQHFIKLVLVFNISYNKKKFVVKWFLASLLAPMPFVYIGYFYDLKTSDSEYCWLSKPYLYYLFIVPVFCLLFISFTFYIICVVKICNLYCKCKLFEQERMIDVTSSYNHKYVISLLLFSMLSLSLTWLIGILIVVSSNLNDKVFKYLAEFFFCLFNSFHGISLLIAQYMAQKYSSYKSHYQLRETKSNSSSSAFTISTLDTQRSQNKKKSCQFLTNIFSKDFKKRNFSKPVQEIKLNNYNCIHVNNYNYSSTTSKTISNYNIDKNSTINYSFYHNNVNYIINSSDDRNSTINIDYFINFNRKNENDNINNRSYIVSLDAYTSSI
jgi:hypothetical protein